MIALNILFQKVFKLPKSRWPAMKDKTINIPINENDVIRTIEALPRTPSSAGIIPINLKRKLSFKNAHMTQFISVPKVLKALHTLKILGHPYYQFVKIDDDFVDDLRDNDIEGFNFIYPEDEVDLPIKTSTESQVIDDVCQKPCENIKADDLDDSDRDEKEYEQKDAVKKWQFSYNQSICFTNNYPEIDYREDNSGGISIAPGEGKYPSNILNERD